MSSIVKEAYLKKQLFLIVLLFSIGFVSLIATQIYFHRYSMDKLKIALKSQEAKIEIINYIRDDVIKIKSYFFDFVAVTKSVEGVKVVKEKIEREIKELRDAIKILKEGGSFKREIRLNSRENVVYIQKQFFPLQKNQTELVFIMVEPKLVELEGILQQYETLLEKRVGLSNQKSKDFFIVKKKIKFQNKRLVPFFKRIVEDLNTILLKENQKVIKLRKDIEKRDLFYFYLEIFITLFIIVAVFMFVIKISLEIIKLNKKIRKQLYLDSLTQIENRFALKEYLKKNDTLTVVILIDIEAFKNINEVYGAEIGNQVLIKFSKILVTIAKKIDCRLFRVGADEFVLVTKRENIKAKKIRMFYEIIAQELNKNNIYIPTLKDSIELDVVIGVSIRRKNSLEKADIALNFAKKHKKNIVFYSPSIDLTKNLKSLIYWKKEIKQAIAEDRVVPFFQAVVDKNNKISKYESLMRIKKEDGYISPYLFLEVAKKSNLYNQISKIIILKSLDFFRNRGEDLSINFSYQDIHNKELVDELKIKLSDKKLKNRVIFEITESEYIEDFKIVKKFIDEFRKFGVKFAIDDFGTGYSNFKTILEINPDFIKIDGTLIKDIDTNKNSFELVNAIVKFSKKLNIKTIAEFVHSEEVFEITKSLEIDYFQGYYFYEPIEKPEVI